MTEYNDGQVAVMQKFVDMYRAAPESLSLGEGFISFSLDDAERGHLYTLAQQGLVDTRPNFFRLSDKCLPVITQLRDQGRIVFN